MFDAQLYRNKEEIERWRARPIRRLQGWLEENGLIDQDLAQIEAEVRAEVEAALAFAEAGTSSRSRIWCGS